jgi:bleomycin hydrolase
MKRYLSISLFLLMLVVLKPILSFPEASPEGGLNSEVLSQIQGSFKMDVYTKTILNALTNNEIKNLALNREIVVANNDLFNHRIKTKGITNQKSSGRCWLFAGLNILRPRVMEKLKLNEFEFSQNYLFFWDKMEKANTFLENVISTRDKDLLDRDVVMILSDPFPDGGYWSYVVALINKYGVVPQAVMPETQNSSNTGMMDNLIARKLRQDAAALRDSSTKGQGIDELRGRKVEMLKDIYHMLVLNLGLPPTNFQWRYEDKDTVVSQPKTYTPQAFFKEVVGVNLNDYVSLVNSPNHPYDHLYQIRSTRNLFDSPDVTFINLDIKQLEKFTLTQILKDEPVWFGCDVRKDQNGDKGIMAPDIYDYQSIYGVDLQLTKSDRLLYRESTANHAMVFVGVDTLEHQPTKWLVENSWGDAKGNKGYWTMYDKWFDEYVYEVIINRKYLPGNVLDILKTRPEELPPWDPLSSILK